MISSPRADGHSKSGYLLPVFPQTSSLYLKLLYRLSLIILSYMDFFLQIHLTLPTTNYINTQTICICKPRVLYGLIYVKVNFKK